MESHALFLTLTPNIIHKAVIVSNHYFYRLFSVCGSTRQRDALTRRYFAF